VFITVTYISSTTTAFYTATAGNTGTIQAGYWVEEEEILIEVEESATDSLEEVPEENGSEKVTEEVSVDLSEEAPEEITTEENNDEVEDLESEPEMVDDEIEVEEELNSDNFTDVDESEDE